MDIEKLEEATKLKNKIDKSKRTLKMISDVASGDVSCNSISTSNVIDAVPGIVGLIAVNIEKLEGEFSTL